MRFDPANYTSEVGDAHRKGLGQFFTHAKVAEFMVNWVLESNIRELYDPAFGLGAFLPNDASIVFSASEIDPTVIEYCKKSSRSDLRFVRNEDYLTSWGRTHANIVCNPPYMRFQKFLNREAVFESFRRNISLQLSGYTNTASAFLMKSLCELKKGGRLSYVMPLEFLNAGYGAIVKRKLLDGKHLVAIIALECEKEVFPDATTSVGILLYDSATIHSQVRFYSLTDIADLQNFEALTPSSQVDVDVLDPNAKWLPYFQKNKVTFNAQQMVRLDYYGRFSRGIATGANKFFVLSQSQADALGLALEERQPCIARSSQVARAVFCEDDMSKMQESDEPMLLFTAGVHASPGARDYIKSGESQGLHQRFLTKHRNPWYKTEARSPSPLLLGVFSRGGYKIILNKSKAINLTCYHGFQPNLFGREYVDRLFLYFLSQTGREVVGLSMRKYGDALDKFEPNDVNSAWVPKPEFFNTMSLEEVEEGVKVAATTGRLPEALELKFKDLRRQQAISELPAVL